MKAWVLEQYGEPEDVVVLGDLETPSPGTNELLVEVRSVGYHDVAWVAVSRAPIEKLLAYRTRMGWSFPWVSSFANDFNFDFKVSSTEQRPLLEYNFREVTEEMRQGGPGELPGMSTFAMQDGVVYHTYSAYARGLDAMWGMYQWLDRAPLGRNERGSDGWLRRHDSYTTARA